MNTSLRILSSKADSNTWGASQGVNWSWSQCIKSHHAQTSSGKGLPSHFWNRNIVRSILPWLKRKRTGLLLSGPKSSFQMKVNSAFHLEIKVPESGGRVETHRIHVAWRSIVFSEVHSQSSHLPGHFRALHASFWWQALWRCWFYFTAGLGTCPHCQRYQKLVQWPWCYCAWLASKLAWPEPQREYMGYCQEEDERHQTQQCRWPEGRLFFLLCSLRTFRYYKILLTLSLTSGYHEWVHLTYTSFLYSHIPWSQHEMKMYPFIWAFYPFYKKKLCHSIHVII